MPHTDSGRDLIARAIIRKHDAILVNGNFNRKTGAFYVALPGGHIDAGESCTAALQREIEEELAASAEVGELVFVSENIYAGREKSETHRHELTLVFEATLAGEKTDEDGRVFSPESWKNFHWLPESQLADANLLPATIKNFLLARRVRYEFLDSR